MTHINFKDLETKRANEEVESKKLLLKLKTKLVEMDASFLKKQESASSADFENAKKLLAGIEVSDLGKPLANFQEQRRALLTAIDLQIREIKKSVSKKRIQLKMLKPWGLRDVGDEVLFDPRKGRPLVKEGIAIEVERTLKENPVVRKKKVNKKIKLKLLEPWGEYGKGSVVMFGESKAMSLIDKGTAEKTTESIKEIQRYKKIKA